MTTNMTQIYLLSPLAHTIRWHQQWQQCEQPPQERESEQNFMSFAPPDQYYDANMINIMMQI